MTKALAPAVEIVEQKADAAVEAEVDRLLRKAESLSDMAEPDAAARVLLGIASLRSRNAGLDKRHAAKVEVTKTPSIDDWVRDLESKG